MSINKAFILLLLTFLNVNAQKFELGKVSIEELKEKSHPKDTSAVAAVLFEKGRTFFEYNQDRGFQMKTEVQIRIKIYKKEGYQWANHKVSYYTDGDSKESVYYSDVITYNLVDGKVEKTKLKSDGVFNEKINKYWSQKKITMPNVKEGSIIEFQYVKQSPNYGDLPDWRFQSSIPVNYSEYSTFIPEYFTYKTNQKGFLFPKTTVEKNSKSITLNFKERSENTISKTTFSTENVNYTETKTTYLAENMPAVKDEAFVNNINNYISAVSNELSMTQFPNSTAKLYATDWETVAKKIYESDDFGPELSKTGYFEEDLKPIFAGVSSRDEKIAAIFNFVKSKVKWNETNGYTCDDGVKTAYKNKTGNVAEINLMLTAMLRYAGIEANPVLVSTRSNGIAIFPNRSAFNYVIAAVEIENDFILLDATEKYSSPNVLPLRDLNWFGRLIRKNGTSTQVELSPKIQSKDIVNLMYNLKTDGSIEGKIRHQISDHKAFAFRQKYVDLTSEAYLEKFETSHKNIEVSDYKRENNTENDKPILETYLFKDTKSLEIIGDKMYLSPMIFESVSQNPFKQEKREYPVDFGYPMLDKYSISINIPEGYVVETLPIAASLAMPENIGTFKYLISNTGNVIQLQISTEINTAIVPSDYYESLKEFFKRMIEKQNEKIVLKKV